MDDTGQQCAECLGPVSTAVHAQNGASRLLPISELAIPEGICYTRGSKE